MEGKEEVVGGTMGSQKKLKLGGARALASCLCSLFPVSHDSTASKIPFSVREYLSWGTADVRLNFPPATISRRASSS